MKKAIIFTSALLLLFNFSYSQEAVEVPERKVRGTVKIGPLDFLANTLSFGFERSIGGQSSIQIFGNFIMKEGAENYNQSTMGGGGELQFRKYLINKDQNLKGLYAGVFGKYNYLQTTSEYSYMPYYDPYYGGYPSLVTDKQIYALHQGSAGFIAGYQFMVKDIFVFDLYVGGGIKLSESNRDRFYNNYFYYGPTYDNTLSIFYREYNGIFPKAGAKVGITF